MDSFISWIGGKKLLRKQIIALFPQNYNRYIEVFGGAGWVLFGKEHHTGELEVYNDFDGELVNLFRCVKYHAEELQRYIIPINSRELFLDEKARAGIRGQTDIQRAADFYMRIRTSYGANRREFGCNAKAIQKGIDLLPEVQKRLQSVVIENKSFENLIAVYDRPGALFYCDPPYHGTEKLYDSTFGEAEHRLLKDTLSSIQGRFILSYNDDEYVRDLYAEFKITAIERQNNLAGRYGSGAYKELIITNF